MIWLTYNMQFLYTSPSKMIKRVVDRRLSCALMVGKDPKSQDYQLPIILNYSAKTWD